MYCIKLQLVHSDSATPYHRDNGPSHSFVSPSCCIYSTCTHRTHLHSLYLLHLLYLLSLS